MRTIHIKVNDTDFEFICDSRDTRSGFAHDCHLFIDSHEETTATCYYLNRTWEYWTYQSVCVEAIDELIDSLIDNEKTRFKDSHNYKRLTAKREQEFNKILDCLPDLNKLKKCKEQLMNNLY